MPQVVVVNEITVGKLTYIVMRHVVRDVCTHR